MNTVDTGSQVCSLLWNSEYRELASSHGFAENQITLWRYPGMAKVGDLPGHSTRVLHMAVSPDGQTMVSAAADENLKFWKAWPTSGQKKKKSKESAMDNFQTLSIR
jgi:cell division cycle protein 20 (cofactor of APC complex)